ncbi:glycosyltransferase family 2 protein [Ruegeria arenilitoris]|uniref:glycosyltransferase family 2 protein n=1 Tax=Ruegeria arenilitoris TaxID=1173585 RepID=UPI00147F268D|nr:glycosyltransferase family 2 protein [Ruegeria arenilitoris]
MKLPKISLIIPNLNCVEFIEEAIRSIVDQRYPNLELILSDGGSTDGSLKIVQRYSDEFTHVICGPDTGQANALNRGFALATGDVLGWVNSDDILRPGGLALVGSIFARRPDIDWLTGKISSINEDGKLLHVHRPRPVSYERFLAGDYQWIQQESTFWRRCLWDVAGKGLNEDLKLAVDGELWLRFLRHSKLTPVHAPIGAFRFRKGQRSEAIENYHHEMLKVIQLERQKIAHPKGVLAQVLQLPLELRSQNKTDMLFPDIRKYDAKPVKGLQLLLSYLRYYNTVGLFI